MAVHGLDKLIIDKGMFQTTRVRLRDKEIVEISICSRDEISLVGKVYRGRVTRVVGGINAAFVDIGEAQNAYLQLSGKTRVRQGEDILVQVVKDADGGKGAKLTLDVSIPGRYSVYLPLEKVVRVSKSIESQNERERLLSLGESITGGDFGLVIRTQASGVGQDDFIRDLNELQGIWESVSQEGRSGMGPKLIYQGPSIAEQAAKAILEGEVGQLIINDTSLFNELISYLRPHGKEAVSRVELFDKSSDIFDYLGIKKRIKSLGSKRIWLKSGGNIVIEKTEALTVIDVNTAKSIKGHSAEDTIYKTNLEAADEIATQIKLRDLGGIILVDFIDMKSAKNRAELLSKMKSRFAFERGKTIIYGYTELGIMEISRKNEKKDISAHLLEECRCCKGSGRLPSRLALLDLLEKEVRRIKTHAKVECVMFELDIQFYETLSQNSFAEIREISREHGLAILLVGSFDMYQGGFKMAAMGSLKDLLEKAKKYRVFEEIQS